MSMSDCEKCWDTPCACGWEYRRWTNEQLRAQRDMLQGILDARAAGTATRYVDPPSPKLSLGDYEKTFSILMSDIDGAWAPCACGEPSRHRGGPANEPMRYWCCRCYVKAGNAPADWHSGCMRAYAEVQSSLR
jgi:hypothetical protein